MSTGTGTLIRLILRRDRVALPIWIVVLALVPVGAAASMASAYPTDATRRAFAAGLTAIPTLTAMFGPVFDAGVGGLTAWRISVAAALLFGIFSIVMVIRHTRGDEESGRLELLRSAAIGRNAPLTAALVVSLAAHVVVAMLVTAGLAVQGLSVHGSLALAVSLAATGWWMTAVAGVVAQLTESARFATVIAVGVLGGALVLRIVANMGLSWLMWVTPMGWVQELRPFADEKWGMAGLVLALAAALVALSFALSARRDLGAGLVRPRPGPASAPTALRGPFMLAWRLNRGLLLGVSLAFAALGALLGSIAHGVGGAVASSPALAAFLLRFGAHDAGEAMVSLLGYTLAEVLAGYAIVVALRLFTEETEGRAAAVLATGISRSRWAASHLALAVVAPTVVLFSLGAATGLTYGISLGDPGAAFAVLGQTMAKAPAVWVFPTVAVALYGLLPRVAIPLSWAVFGAVLVLEFCWELRLIPSSVFAVSPFYSVNPANPISIWSLLALIGVATVLTVTGMSCLRRRDVG